MTHQFERTLLCIFGICFLISGSLTDSLKLMATELLHLRFMIGSCGSVLFTLLAQLVSNAGATNKPQELDDAVLRRLVSNFNWQEQEIVAKLTLVCNDSYVDY